jgi:hypothetical protein
MDLPQARYCDDGDAQADLMCGDALRQGDAVPVTGYPSCHLDRRPWQPARTVTTVSSAALSYPGLLLRWPASPR